MPRGRSNALFKVTHPPVRGQTPASNSSNSRVRQACVDGPVFTQAGLPVRTQYLDSSLKRGICTEVVSPRKFVSYSHAQGSYGPTLPAPNPAHPRQSPCSNASSRSERWTTHLNKTAGSNYHLNGQKTRGTSARNRCSEAPQPRL